MPDQAKKTPISDIVPIFENDNAIESPFPDTPDSDDADDSVRKITV